MSIAEKNPQAVDRKTKRNRGKIKGRVVDLNALLDVKGLLRRNARCNAQYQWHYLGTSGR